MIQLVCGFAYWRNNVLLIRKNRPERQKGLLNGVGGHAEMNEGYRSVMAREFLEKTNIRVAASQWRPIARIVMAETKVVHFYTTKLGDQRAHQLKTTTDEEVDWYFMDEDFIYEKVVPNIRWLVPLGYYILTRDPTYSLLQISSKKETA